MERLARQREPAVGADSGSHPETLTIHLDATLNVTEIVLESADLDGKLVTKVIEDPLLVSETLDDLLASGAGWAHGSEVVVTAGGFSGPPEESHSRTGIPSTQRSSMTPAPPRTLTVTQAGL